MLLLQGVLGVLLPFIVAGLSLPPLPFMGKPGPSGCGRFEEFRHCGTPCPPTCDTLRDMICCEVACIAGCFCMDGYILEKDPKTGPRKCIPLGQCPSPGVLAFERPAFSVLEGSGKAIITVVRLNGSYSPISCRYRVLDPAGPYAGLVGELEFPDGVVSRTIEIPLQDNAIRDPDFTVRLELFEPSRKTHIVSGTLVLTILDDDMTPGYLELEKTQFSVPENVGVVRVQVLRHEGSDGQLRVKYRTVPDSASTNVDFSPITGNLVFEEGETSKTVMVSIVDDEVRETPEKFRIELFDFDTAPGVLNFRSRASVLTADITIVDNDMRPGILQLERLDYTVSENVGTVVVSVIRMEGQDGQVKVKYETRPISAKAGNDFEPQMGQLFFEEGELRKTIRIKIMDDSVREPEESFELLLFDATPGPGTINFTGLEETRRKATITITDDDMNPGILQLDRSTYDVMEDVGSVRVDVVRTGGQDGRITVQYQTRGLTANENRDFVPTSGALIFEEGETRKSIVVQIKDDAEKESLETLEVLLVHPTPGPGIVRFRGFGRVETSLNAIIKIRDNDMTPGIPVLERDSYEVTEGVGVLQIGVQRLDGMDGQIEVHYQTVPKTAVAGQDFESVSGVLVFDPEETRKLITVRILNDDVREPSKYFEIQLTDARAGTGVINFRGLVSTPKVAVITITDDDMTPGILQFESSSYEVRENVGRLQISVVRMRGTDGEIRVKYRTIDSKASANHDFLPTEGELIFNERDTRKDITIQIVDDDVREPIKSFQVQLYDASHAPGVINFNGLGPVTTTVVTITDDDMRPGSFVFERPSFEFPETVGTVRVGVVRVGGSDGKIRVKYKTVPQTARVNQDFLSTDGELVFEEGQTRKDIVVQILDDDVREPTKEFELQLLDPSAGSEVLNFRRFTTNPTAMISIIDNDMKPGILKMEKTSYEVNENVGTVTISVVRFDGTDGEIRVRYRTIQKTAHINQDFVQLEGELVFEEGVNRKDITIQIVNDDVREPTKTFEVQLFDATSGVGDNSFRRLTANPTAVVTILDDDMRPGTFQLEKPSYDISENVGTITIGVIRVDGTDGEVSVLYKTIPQTAQGHQDFVPIDGKLVFGEKETRKDIVIKIVDDDVREATKTFEVQLVDLEPGAGVINFRGFTSNPSAIVTIRDDDMRPGTFQLERSSYDIFENSGTITIGVIRVDGTDGEMSVLYKTIPQTAQSHQDFVPIDGKLVFGEKETRKDIVIKIVDDNVREATKTFEVQLVDLEPGAGVINFRRFTSNPTAIVTIRDDDMRPGVLQIERHSYEVLENVGILQVGVVRLDGKDGEITVKYKTVPTTAVMNQDFVFVEGELVFAEGETRKDITIQIIDDEVREPTKTFEIKLSEPRARPEVTNFKELGPIRAAVVTITDNDMKPGELQLEEAVYQFFENVGTVRIPVVRVDGSDGQIHVFYRTAPKTALLGSDFVFSSGELVFQDGETRKFIEIPIVNDNLKEETKSFEIELLNPEATVDVVNFRGFLKIPKAEVYILDDDVAPGLLDLEQVSYVVPENTGQVQISVIRKDGTDGRISVRYRTVARSAAAQTDFLPVEGQLIFQDGEDRKFILVQILNDNVKESAEMFEVQLFDPQAETENINFRGTGSKPVAVITIQDDDTTPGVLELDRPTYFVNENVGVVQVVVVRRGGTDGQLRCQYQSRPKMATEGTDFAPVRGELVFEDGETSKVITVQILDDRVRESRESFEIVLMEQNQGLERVLGQTHVTEVVISDDDMSPGFLELEETSYEVSEKVGTLSVVVRRVDGSDGQIRVGYVTSPQTALPGFDFTPIKGDLVFEDGETRKTIQIQIRDDNQKEPTENFEIQLVDPGTGLNFRNLGQKQRALVTINDDDWSLGSFEFEKASYTVVENVGSLNVVVTRQGGSDGQVKIRYQTVPKTAQPSTDFQPILGELVFNDGETQKTIIVPIVNDGVRETTETFEIQLVDATPTQRFVSFRGLGQRRTVPVTIFDDDGNPGFLELEEPTYVVSEGIRTLQVVVNRRGGSDGRIQCRYQTTARSALAGIDFEPGSGELIFEDGETQKIINIQIVNDKVKESIKSFEVQLLDPLPALGIANFRVVGSRMKALITIADDDIKPGLIQMEIPTYTVKESVGTLHIPVIRVNGSDGQIKVTYQAVPRTAQESTDFAPLSGDLVFEDGESRKVIHVQILNDRSKEPTEIFEVRLTDASPGPGVLNFDGFGFIQKAVVTILDDDMNHGFLELENPSYHFSEGSGTATMGVVRLEGTDGRIRVRYQTVQKTAIPGTDYVDTSGELVFEDGVRRKDITVRILNDHRKEATKTFEVQLFEPTIEGEDVTFRALGSRSISLVSIWDDDHNPGVFQFRENQVSVREGSARVSLTIIRSDGTDGSVSLRLRAMDGSARLGEDYTIRSSDISFSDGEREKTVDIDIIDDNIREGAENFKIGLFDPTNGAILGQNSIFAVTILDDDGFVERPSMPASDETKLFFTDNFLMVPRGSPVVRFKVRREGSWIPVKFLLETLEGTARAGVDYKHTVGELQFNSNDIELTLAINLKDNPNRLGVRSFQIRISNPSSGVVVRGRDVLTVFIGGSEGPSSESKITFHQQFQSSVSSSGRRSGSINPADLSPGVSSASIQLPPIRGAGSLSGQGLPSAGSSGQSSLPALPPSSQGQRRKIPQGQQDCAPGLIFNPCFFGCPQICNLVADPVCNKGCTPTCVCPKGLILESLHSTKCVPPSQCPRGGGSGGGLLGGGGGRVVNNGGGGGLVSGLLGGGGGGLTSGGGRVNVGGTVSMITGGSGGGGLTSGLLGGGGGGLTSGGGRVNVGGTASMITGGSGGGGLVSGLLGGGGGGLASGGGRVHVGGSASMSAGGKVGRTVSASAGGGLLGGLLG